MRNLGATLLLALMLPAAFPVAAQTYKWVDQKGVTNYGTKPPPGVAAVEVDTQPAAITDSSALRREMAEYDRAERRTQRAEPRARSMAAPVRGMDFDIYSRLQRGMTEGELLLRAGNPDHVSLDNRRDHVRSFHYFPTASDPFLTVVTVRDGRIANIERTRRMY